jgi:hypothetical protein
MMILLYWLGWLIFLTGLVWLTVKSYKLGGILWAVLVFFLTVPAGLAFCIKKKTGWLQFAIAIIGWIIVVAFAIGYLKVQASTP